MQSVQSESPGPCLTKNKLKKKNCFQCTLFVFKTDVQISQEFCKQEQSFTDHASVKRILPMSKLSPALQKQLLPHFRAGFVLQIERRCYPEVVLQLNTLNNTDPHCINRQPLWQVSQANKTFCAFHSRC